MTIKLTTCIVGADWTFKAGDTVELEDKHAQRLIDAGFAVAVKAQRQTRTTSAPQPPLETTEAK